MRPVDVLELAMDRLLWDRLIEMSDLHAAQSFRRIKQNARRNYSREFWWKQGAPAQERGQDVGKAIRVK